MKLKTFLPAILAVVLGLAAAFLVRNSMMKTKPTAVVTAPKMVPAVVATADLLAGQQVSADNLEVTTIEATNPPTDTISNPTEIVGRVLSAPIVKGQAIHQTNLEPRGANATLPSLVPAGMRAITLVVDEANSLSGMLLPGCHVDVICTMGAGKDSFARTLVSNVLVQAVGTRLTSAKPEDGKEAPAFHTATLIVAPRDAQLIDLASGSTKLRLALRPLTHSPSDDAVAERTTVSDLLGAEGGTTTVALTTPPSATQPSNSNESAPIATAVPAQNDVTLILGSQITHQKVAMPDVSPAPAQTDTADTNTDPKPLIDGAEPSQQ